MKRTRPAPTVDVDEVTLEMATSIANVREALGPLDEAVRGYRDQLERDGWSTQAAEQMAIALHQLMLTRLFTGTG